MARRELPELPDNSKSGREEGRERETQQERRASVARGKVHKSLGRTLLRTFIMEDPKDVAEEIWDTEIAPGIKSAASNAFDMFIYGIGGAPRSKKRSGYSSESRVSYDKYYSDRERDRGDHRRDSGRSRSSARDLEYIEFESVAEAKDVLQGLFDEAVHYDKVTVAVYYDLAGIDASDVPYTAAKYGWYKENLEGVRVERNRGGVYTLSLPKPVALT